MNAFRLEVTYISPGGGRGGTKNVTQGLSAKRLKIFSFWAHFYLINFLRRRIFILRAARVCLFLVLLLYTITITKTQTKKSRDPLKMKKINLKKLAIRSAFRNDQK